MSEELEVLKTVTGRLDAAGIPYMVTGSIAVSFYAVPRMTRDIDIVVELSERDADQLVSLFQDEFYLDDEMVRRAIAGRDMFNLIHTRFVIKVDLVVRKDTEYRRTEFARRRAVAVEGHPFWIVAPEDLILSKLVWAKDSRSEVQLSDVRNILASVETMAREYLAQWAERLSVGSLYREVTA
ncbi:MAG: nucleotidyl transferase AbiEii/AbiGii toxin family protein [Nitrospirales bacterium]